MRFKKLGVLAAGVLFFAGTASAATYAVDPDHTGVSFKIRHLFSNVQGHFEKFEGVIEYEPGKPELWKVSGTVDAASINTNVAQRDNHLRSKDFFDVEQFPSISFTSTGVTPDGKKMKGLLTLHGVEKPVELDVQAHGVGKDPWGNVRAGFTAVTKINRKDFGLTWNETLETGQLLVGEEVEITLDVEGIQKEEKRQ